MNTPESTDYSGRGADPYRRDPQDPQFAPGQHEYGGYEPAPGGATDLLDFPPLPEYLTGAGYAEGAGYGDADSAGADPTYSFPDPRTGSYPGPGFEPAPPAGPAYPAPSAPAEPQASGLHVSSAAAATARLLIKLPSQPPQPSTTLRPHAVWEDRDDDAPPDGAPGPRRGVASAAPFAQVAASPARPSALPSELAALTTATLVVPLPGDTRPTQALLTTTLPPSAAARQNAAALADAFHDTLEQVFGLDLEKAAAADVGLDRPDEQCAEDLPGTWFRDESADPGAVAPPDAGTGHGPGASGTGGFVSEQTAEDDIADSQQPPHQYMPGAVASSGFGGTYGVPTQPAAFPGFGAPYADGHDPSRHALALRYLGGIFHNSSGESAYLDPGSAAARALREPAAALSGGPFTPPDAPTQQLAKVSAQAVTRSAEAAAKPAAATRAQAQAESQARPRARHSGPAAPEPPVSRAVPSRPAKPGVHGHNQGADDATPDEIERRGNSRLLTAAAVLAALFAVLYGVALAVASGVFGGGVPRGTVVAGVPIGGLSPAAAERLLNDRLGDSAHGPIRLLVGQSPVDLDPAKAGLSLNAASTVRAAQHDRTNPLVIIPALFGATHQVAPVTSVDTAALRRALSGVAASYNTPMVEGSITFHAGKPVVTAPKKGRGFNLAAATAAISSGYLRTDDPIRIPVRTLYPKATPAALQSALEAIARPAVSAPIALVTGEVTTQLTPVQIGDALTIGPDSGGRMVARLDGALLRGYLGRKALAQEQSAADAAFSVVGGEPVLVPAREGSGFAPGALARAVLPELTAAAPRTANVPIGPLPADFTTADAQALGVTDVLGSSTLPVPDAPDRFANVQRAVSLIAGAVVQPGDTWSFLQTVGAPTTANGFAVSAAAQRAGIDPSGGIDTVATAVFDAAFSSGMGDTQHHPHASYIDRYPVGLDAAVAAPGTDLQWTNTSGHPVYLYASYANNSLTVALLGQKAYDEVKVEVSPRTAIVQPSATRGSCAQGAQPGFQVDVTRTLLRGGSRVGSEQFHVAYAPQSAQGCSGGSSSGAATGSSPTNGSDATGSGGGGGSRGGAGTPPSSAPSPAPTGILGGLLH